MSTAAPLQNTATSRSPLVDESSHAGLLLQRKCSCGGSVSSSLSGECEECNKKHLQKKLNIGASNDPLEQEADRVADQVLAAPVPAHSTVSSVTPSIQRFTGQSTGDEGAAPPSVDRVLSSSGRPLDPALQQDMGQRLGHDFSRVRVHTGSDAEQSASDVSASAYTVGHNIVFGAGKFSPGSNDGRRLLAHELTHVVQQSGLVGIRTDQSNDKRGRGSITPITHGIIQCDKGDDEKKSPSWTVDELKKMLDTCDGGLGIWAKAKKANKDKDPKVTPGDKGATNSATGDITLDKTQDKCFAVQQLIQELSNLSRMADFKKILSSATAGDVSRDEFIKAIEKIEYETGVKNVLTAFDACKDTWKCKTTPKEWARKAKDFDDYFANLLSNTHKEHYGKWWDKNCKAAYDKKNAKK